MVILIFILCLFVMPIHCKEQLIFTSSVLKKEYTIRVKQPILCEKNIQYSGYIDNLVTNEHVFFIFLESRFAPNTDPVVLSLNGQVGCSSITNMWFETGLCLIQKSGIETNPFSFNNVANILYIDQPSDVGFSYTTGKKALTTEDVIDSMYWFLQCFFNEFKQFQKNEFHIAGTSFASHFVPSLATRIIRENRFASLENKIVIQLKSIILGNGLIQPHIQQLSNAEYSCDNDHNQYKPIFDPFTCQKMRTHRGECEYLSRKCHWCLPAHVYCKKTLVEPFYKKTDLNPYDIRKNCIPNLHVDSCYSVIQDIVKYLNLQEIKTEFGVDYEAGEFLNCNKRVKSRFKDDLMNTMYHIEKLLATHVRVLVYAGEMNWYNNWHGQLDWLSKLDWVGQVDFNQAIEKVWYSYVSGQKAGSVKSFSNLAFVKVYNAGYYTIYDQPASMIDLYSRWLLNLSLSY